MYEIPIGVISIDSLKFRIPLEWVLIKDKDLGSLFVPMRIEDGELIEDEEFKKKTKRVNYKGVSVYFGLESQIGRDRIVREYLVCLVNSKLLHYRYFEGITYVNVGLLYDELMSLDVVSFDYVQLLKAECTDVDFKQDHICPQFGAVINDLNRNAKSWTQVGRGTNLFKKANNMGIQFGERNTATKDYPFLKLYHKGIHAMGAKDKDMFAFYAEFLSDLGYDLKDVIRVETTIKNKNHFRKHGILDTSLQSLLNLSQDEMKPFFDHAYKVHLNPRKTSIKMSEDKVETMKPRDVLAVILIKQLMALNVSYDQILNTVTDTLYQPNQRHRITKFLKEIYEAHIKNTPQDNKLKKLDSFYERIGWL